ncbi:MAG: type II secretion system protein [Lachnospiraceae bacterium]
MRNNKGFSLVELIIVIAIMAILVGVMAPQLIKYIEKSNVSADTQVCDSIHSAVLTSMMDPEVVTATDSATQSALAGLTSAQPITSIVGQTDRFSKSVMDIMGVSSATDITLKSHGAAGLLQASNIMVRTDGNRCSVWIVGSDATGSKGTGTATSVISVY